MHYRFDCIGVFSISGFEAIGDDLHRSARLNWSGNGYFSPGPISGPELIGLFVKKSDCEAAVEGWELRQVVGNPIFAEGRLIDRN